MDKEEKSVIDILEEVKADICDNYCKYPEDISDDEKLMSICGNYPLSRL